VLKQLANLLTLASLLSTSLVPLPAQEDAASLAYKAWEAEHRTADYKVLGQALFEASAEWVAKWPESPFAWKKRRDSLMFTQSHSPELWKQVDDNIIRLSPPHTFASYAARDWVTAGVNLKEAEELIASEIDWQETRVPSVKTANPFLTDRIDQAESALKRFAPLCTLAGAQIELKEFDRAHATIAHMRGWLAGDFKHYYDQDRLETFPDYESKYFTLSAQLAHAEGKLADALAFYQKVVTNPYFRREYGGHVKETQALWKELAGTDDGWAAFSEVPALPAGVPTGYPGISFLPWVALDYKLPDLNVPGLGSRIWTNRDFGGKATMIYLWASWCLPCRPHLRGLQGLYDKIKGRPDIQLVTLSVDEDPAKLAQFMKANGFTFPVMVSKPYTERLMPDLQLGQFWIVDETGSIRLQRRTSPVGGAQAFIDEAVYKLTQLSNASSPSDGRTVQQQIAH
jgi:thiol-disulfide isomerase/thioredoxin